jgi:hypothetical protein
MGGEGSMYECGDRMKGVSVVGTGFAVCVDFVVGSKMFEDFFDSRGAFLREAKVLEV